MLQAGKSALTKSRFCVGITTFCDGSAMMLCWLVVTNY
ncbi:hypothetical protein CUS_4933 [Ruminococcus albus 8]|uniref:Uncharacterized protein n=1 Tax=Ruminococcus albus 8 TaxID=246199 RepID=E9S7K8_RUMAL|nr:hypothetical protein CUS_4933 [Ruminococcus albus 8]